MAKQNKLPWVKKDITWEYQYWPSSHLPFFTIHEENVFVLGDLWAIVKGFYGDRHMKDASELRRMSNLYLLHIQSGIGFGLNTRSVQKAKSALEAILAIMPLEEWDRTTYPSSDGMDQRMKERNINHRTIHEITGGIIG